MTWYLWGCIVLGVLLAVLSPVAPLVAALRLGRHLKALGDSQLLRDVEGFSVQAGRLSKAGSTLPALAARVSAAVTLLGLSLRQMRSPLFYFGRLP